MTRYSSLPRSHAGKLADLISPKFWRTIISLKVHRPWPIHLRPR